MIIGRAAFAALALGCVGAIGFAQPAPPVANAANQSPAVMKVVELAREGGMKTMVCAEFDDHQPTGTAGMTVTILAQQPGSNRLLSYTGPKLGEISDLLINEQKTAGKTGWRRIVIVVDGPAVDVQREPWQGPLNGALIRLRADADSAFPGHAEP